ncbi:MAG: reverse transcriptase domain-containing protein, partial [Gaiellaceae bacterium]
LSETNNSNSAPFTIDDTENQNTETFYDTQDNDNYDNMIGAEVIMPHQGATQKGKVVSRKRYADGTLADDPHEKEYIVEFPNGSQIISEYNDLLTVLHKQFDDQGNEYFIFNDIIGHKQGTGGRGRTKGWLLEVEWRDGTTSWNTLSSMKTDNPYEVAKYAADNDLLTAPAFQWWAPTVLKKKDRWIRAATKQRLNNRYKFGIEIPRNTTHALELDRANNNNLWRDAIAKEMNALSTMKCFDIRPRGENAPETHKRLPLIMIFTVKMDFTRKARLVAGGHVTDPPTVDTYSGVAAKDSVRIAFLLASVNELDLMLGDIGNAYVNAYTQEKVYALAGPEFNEHEGCVVIIVKALYGLKTSSARWHAHLSDTLKSIGFKPCRADTDMWMRPAEKRDGTVYYEYLIVYVDDILAISENARSVLLELEEHYDLKGIGPPERYLGATIAQCKLPNGTKAWSMSATQYLKEAIKNVEEKTGQKFDQHRKPTPLQSDYHPELDQSEYLNDDDANYYLSLIGILQWTVELGRIDVCYAVQLMS